ncbi:restriction endonuclease subunit S [Pseudoalteromonas sp. Cnat2-41]|uniref:restriction endonuclease subunit S n=1 Tax=unclassified Pseudoalteromonas TaxID=194690 RepID=UPI001EF8E80E|nr:MULTISPECIES: restriction endonuclease subunit S [unclassified Pseudoalteromonas]MCF2862899.1 restriction endonuclease subunit S [Pseudoalteromonas sp. CNAT2-18]MCG7558649.1 restriction endonuclease subunit S [Pseudoalteromonas sp. CNAT2-18.1]
MEQALYKLPDGWEWRTIEEAAQIGADRGFAPTPDSEGNVPFIGMTDIDQETGQKSTYELRNFDDVKKGYTKFQRNAVLFAKITPCTENNKTALIANVEGGFATTEVFPIHALDSVEPKYLLHFFRSPSVRRFLIDQMEGATGRQRVPLKALKNVSVPVCKLREQKRIVEKLDALLSRIDTAVEHLQESVALADALFESSQSEIFNDVLSNYQHSTIDEICIVTSSKRIFKADYVESGIPFYRTKEIVDLSKDKNISTELFIDKEKFSEICGKFGAPKKGDLLFSAVGTIGVMWIVDEREFYFKDGNLLWLKDMNGVTPEYLKSAISAVLTEKIKDRSQGAAYKAISITNLKAFEIPLPSIEEQKSIVAKIEHVSSVTKKTKQELSLQINDLHNLKASILDSAFKGEL